MTIDYVLQSITVVSEDGAEPVTIPVTEENTKCETRYYLAGMEAPSTEVLAQLLLSQIAADPSNPTEEEMMDLATAVVSAFDLRGYPDMLKVGESAVLPDGVPVKVTRVRNVKPRRGGR